MVVSAWKSWWGTKRTVWCSTTVESLPSSCKAGSTTFLRARQDTSSRQLSNSSNPSGGTIIGKSKLFLFSIVSEFWTFLCFVFSKRSLLCKPLTATTYRPVNASLPFQTEALDQISSYFVIQSILALNSWVISYLPLLKIN